MSRSADFEARANKAVDMVAAGHPMTEAASKHKVSIGAVKARCKIRGITPLGAGRPRKDRKTVDLSKLDAEALDHYNHIRAKQFSVDESYNLALKDMQVRARRRAANVSR